MPGLGEWSEFLTAHGPWPAFCALTVAAVVYLAMRLAATHKRAWEALDANTKAMTALEIVIRERVQR